MLHWEKTITSSRWQANLASRREKTYAVATAGISGGSKIPKVLPEHFSVCFRLDSNDIY